MSPMTLAIAVAGISFMRAPFDMKDVHVQPTIGFSLGNRANEKLTPHQFQLLNHVKQSVSKDGLISTVSLDSDETLDAGEVSPGMQFLFRVPPSDSAPKVLFVTIKLEEAAFGPRGSVANIVPPTAPKPSLYKPAITASKVGRTGTDEAFGSGTTRTIKLDLEAYTDASKRIPSYSAGTIAINLGTLRVANGGKVRARVSIVSISTTGPA